MVLSSSNSPCKCLHLEFHVGRHFSSTQRLVCVKHLDLPSSLFFVGQLNVTFTQCFYFRTSTHQTTFVPFLFYRVLQEAPPPSREQAKTKRRSSRCHNLTSHLPTGSITSLHFALSVLSAWGVILQNQLWGGDEHNLKTQNEHHGK